MQVDGDGSRDRGMAARSPNRRACPSNSRRIATASPMICSRRCNCSTPCPPCAWPPICRITSWIVKCPVRRPLPLQALITKVLERSDSFQGRVAARGQIQIRAWDFPQSAEMGGVVPPMVARGIQRVARAPRSDDAALVFLCELGPPDYAITAKTAVSCRIDGKRL